MRRFVYLWLSQVAAVLVVIGVMWLLSLVAPVVTRYTNSAISNGVMMLVISALTVAFMQWAFRPEPNWFQKVIIRLSKA